MTDLTTRKFNVEGMVCGSCEKIISRQAAKVFGVKSCTADYKTGQGEVTFDRKKTSLRTIFSSIEEKGYSCYVPGQGKDASHSGGNNIFGWILAVAGIVVAIYFVLLLSDKIGIPEISRNMSYGLLFVVGLLTGFHCVAMCGGFVVSYTAKNAKEGVNSDGSHIMYGFGKTLSYTIIGALFGLLGSFIAFTPKIRAAAGILAGLFLVVFGLKMLDIFPALRRFQLQTPDFIMRFISKENRQNANPFTIGLLNGLMIACGPLQAIYIMAAGTGSMIEGAKLLFVFGLGTLPVMLGFGYLTSYISNKMTMKILKASGAIVIMLGLIMVNRGLALSGSGYDINSILAPIQTGTGGIDYSKYGSNNVAVQKDGYQEIRMDVVSSGWSPNKFLLKKDVPVKWIINGKQITGCNKAIQVPSLGLYFDIKPGEQIIEFTPKDEGVISWSCWMGMIQGTFIVKSDINFNNSTSAQNELNKVQTPSGGSCGASGGACGCGSR